MKFLIWTILFLGISSGSSAQGFGPNCRILELIEDPALNKDSIVLFVHVKTPEGYTRKSEIAVIRDDDTNCIGADTMDVMYVGSFPANYDSILFIGPLLENLVVKNPGIGGGKIFNLELKFNNGLIRVHKVQFNYDKPVIYLYSASEINVNIKLDFDGDLRFTYPEYNNGWSCHVSQKNGIVSNEKNYDYLFWEGVNTVLLEEEDLNTGFVVESDSLLGFLENKLAGMGLNASESQDFITYWTPQMLKYDKVFVHFWFEKYEEMAILDVEPVPDNSLRVFMIWSALPKQSTLQPTPQLLPVLNRAGFTLVEWGGSEFEYPLNFARKTE